MYCEFNSKYLNFKISFSFNRALCIVNADKNIYTVSTCNVLIEHYVL